MKIGGSIAMIVIGAILAFAVADMFSGVDLTMIGYIFIAAGLIALVLTIAFDRPRGPKPLNRTSESRTLVDPASGETVRRTDVREE